MKMRIGVIARICAGASLLLAGSAAAQDLSKLGGMLGSGGTSMKSGSMGNVTGLLQYCVQNNYLGGNSGAAGIKDQLLGKMGGASSTPMAGGDTSASKGNMLSKLTGGSNAASQGGGTATSDPSYLSGAKGILQGSNGNSVDLNSLGGGNSDLKSKLTTKVCDTVLKQGKSFLGK
ncbi:MAG TPA: DUF2501 domain-containing protein [Pinirhizobacter sp.]|uniref:DUF2501 domain-containing protein n=1 Tax=Pinirhizobacter sp. TaxID=2950432 RepID=UPI002C3160D2|nr:DUF2501 domain-containing protein [Pinirhizobacter sp.]HMH69733.1 DUF2501 domain-containing protein [Pinirhizobacter sp.]